MVNVSISRRYARALLEVSSESGKADVVAEQLSTFVTAFQTHRDLADVLLNPAYTREQRTAVIDALIVAVGPLEPGLANTLRLLVDRNRLGFLPDIARLYRDMADAQAGRVRGHVTSATALTPEALEGVRSALQKLSGRNVVLETRVDPALLGGVSAQVGSLLYDGSLKTQLELMRRELKRH